MIEEDYKEPNNEGEDYNKQEQQQWEQNYQNEKKEISINQISAPSVREEDRIHRMRLSIDIHSIKDQEFTGLIYAKYSALPELNITHYKTSPALEINTKNVEELFKNSFKSYVFDHNKEGLYKAVKESLLNIEFWHQDRLKKDILIGITTIKFINLLQSQVRKTSQSYARVYDAYLPLDKVDDQKQPINKIASIRVILYLEDLGPADILQQREMELGLVKGNSMEANYENQMPGLNGPSIINLPTYKPDMNVQNFSDDPDKQKVISEMNSLEYKIIWELETWKKAEEAKFKISLKQKEIEFMQRLQEDWKKKEAEKEKIFKKAEGSIALLEQKIKQKVNELTKREQKIVLLEEELHTRINDAARQINNKEEELTRVKRKAKEDKASVEKEKTLLQIKIEELTKQFNEVQQEFEKYRKDQEKTPANSRKAEIESLQKDIVGLQCDLKQAVLVKDQFKTYYEKVRTELVKQKKNYEMQRDTMQTQHQQEVDSLKQEVVNLKMQLQSKLANENAENISPNNNAYSRNFAGDQHQYQPEANWQQAQSQKGKAQGYNYNESKPQRIVQQEQITPNKVNQPEYKEYVWDKSNMGELERLIQERDYWLQAGDYNENDPLIQEYNNQIAQLQK